MAYVFHSRNGHSRTSPNPNSTTPLHTVNSSSKPISKPSRSFPVPNTKNPSVESLENSSKNIAEDRYTLVGHLDTTLFRSFKVQDSWPQFERRKVSSGEGNGFGKENDDELRLPLQSFGWDKLMIASPKVYPDLVRLFYCNLKFTAGSGYPRIVSFVKGTKIILGIGYLSIILGIPATGDRVFFTKENELEKNVHNVTDFYSSIAINKEFGGTIKGKHIKDHLRLLNRFIVTAILPESGDDDDDEITIFQAFILYCFEKNRSLCLPYIILHEMYDTFCHLGERKSLPYGGFLTKVFEYFGVYLDNEDFESSTPINISPLRTMAPKVEKDGEGSSSDEMENVGEDAEEEVDDDYEVEEERERHEVEKQLMEKQANLEENFAQFSEKTEEQLGKLTEKQASLEEKFAQFSEKMEEQFGKLTEKQTTLENQITQFSGKVDDRLAQIGARIEDGFNMINTGQTWLANFLRVYQPSPPPPAK